MKTELKHAAAFLAVAIWADGVYAEGEKEILNDISTALGVNANELTPAVEEALETIKDKDDDSLQEYLLNNATAIDESESKTMMQCAIEIILADDVVSKDEIQTLFDLADATGSVEHADVALMLADLVKYNPETEIKF
jgi:predicted tellurium resistance membrane protein TerC